MVKKKLSDRTVFAPIVGPAAAAEIAALEAKEKELTGQREELEKKVEETAAKLEASQSARRNTTRRLGRGRRDSA